MGRGDPSGLAPWVYQNALNIVAVLDGSGTLVSRYTYGMRTQSGGEAPERLSEVRSASADSFASDSACRRSWPCCGRMFHGTGVLRRVAILRRGPQSVVHSGRSMAGIMASSRGPGRGQPVVSGRSARAFEWDPLRGDRLGVATWATKALDPRFGTRADVGVAGVRHLAAD